MIAVKQEEETIGFSSFFAIDTESLHSDIWKDIEDEKRLPRAVSTNPARMTVSIR